MQNGDGLIWKMAKMRLTAVSAFSPPLISSMLDELLARRLREDVDARLEHVLGVGEPELGATAAEHLREDLLEARVDGVERLLEEASSTRGSSAGWRASRSASAFSRSAFCVV